MDIFTLLGMLLTVVFILVLAYFATKYMSRFKLGTLNSASKGQHMHILDQLTVGADLRLVLVQVGTRYLILGLSAAGIHQLAELSAEEASLWEADKLAAANDSNTTNPSFRASIMEAWKQKRK